MAQKILIAYSQAQQSSSLGYISRISLINYLNREGVPFTLDPQMKDYDQVVYLCADDAFYMMHQVPKGTKKIIVALNDDRDYRMTSKGDIRLSQDAFNLYPKADDLWVRTDAQKAYLAWLGMKNIEVRDFGPTYTSRISVPAEIRAFRAFYQVPKDKKIVITLAEFLTEEDKNILLTLARLVPEMAFFCFGLKNNDEYLQKTWERVSTQDNVRFYPVLPESLYHSALESMSGFLVFTHATRLEQLYDDLGFYRIPVLAYRLRDEMIPASEGLVRQYQDLPSYYKAIMEL